MGFLIIPAIVLVVVAPGSSPSKTTLAEFSRFRESINREISLVDRDGSVREGLLTAATADSVTMKFQSGDREFAKAQVTSAERLKDGRRDGAIKGAIVGAILGIFSIQGTNTNAQAGAAWVGAVAIYSAVGFGLDAAFTHRQPIYRAP